MSKKIIILLIFTLLTYSCGVGEKVKSIYKPVDLRKEPLDPDKKAQKNINEGRGISLGNLTKSKTSYEFSTSNPLWRASLEALDFLPLTTVDYSGGVIISDWYSDTNVNEAIKITIRFLSNEIRSDSIKIQIHKKTCKQNLNCKTELIRSSISQELTRSILTSAVLIDKNDKLKK